MTDEETLRLNGLSRFRKRGGRLVLEIHSHCEVPAGCGGVVLRWRSPDRIPLELLLYTPGEVRAWLDGDPLEEARFELGTGRHLLALEFQGLPGDGGILLLLLSRTSDPLPENLHQDVVLLSGEGSGFLGTGDPPGAGWELPDFEATGWVPLHRRDFEAPSGDLAYRFQDAQRRGAVGLGLAPPPGDGGGSRRGLHRAFVRVGFELAPSRPRGRE